MLLERLGVDCFSLKSNICGLPLFYCMTSWRERGCSPLKSVGSFSKCCKIPQSLWMLLSVDALVWIWALRSRGGALSVHDRRHATECQRWETLWDHTHTHIPKHEKPMAFLLHQKKKLGLTCWLDWPKKSPSVTVEGAKAIHLPYGSTLNPLQGLW